MIPETLPECFVALQNVLSYEDVEKIKNGTENAMVGYHHSLGRWIRNTWGLWGESPLKEWFESKGLKHADDMSGIILTSFWRYLNSKPLEIEEQVKHYVEYWLKNGQHN